MKRLLCLVVCMIAMVGAIQTSHAAPINYFADLDGPSESPPVASPGIGTAQVLFDLDAHFMQVDAVFSGLLGTTTASHIHSATAVPGIGNAGVATQVPTFAGFPLGVTSGTYHQTFNTGLASTWNPTFVTAQGSVAGAEAALAASLAAGTAYFNIHTSFAPGGEIRGFLTVPEPTTILLLGLGLMGLAGIRRTDENDPSRSA